jgi:hypothetical protein
MVCSDIAEELLLVVYDFGVWLSHLAVFVLEQQSLSFPPGFVLRLVARRMRKPHLMMSVLVEHTSWPGSEVQSCCKCGLDFCANVLTFSRRFIVEFMLLAIVWRK